MDHIEINATLGDYASKIDELKSKLSQLNSSSEEYKQTLDDLEKTTKDAESATNDLGESLSTAEKSTSEISSSITSMGTALQAGVGDFGKAGMAVSKFGGSMGVATGTLKTFVKGWKALKVAMASNPIGLVITALAGLGVAIYNTIKSAKEAEKEFNAWKKTISDVNTATKEFSRQNLIHAESLYNAAMLAKSGTDEYRNAIIALQKEYPGYFDNLSTESKDITALTNDYYRLRDAIVAAAQVKGIESTLDALYKERAKLDEEIVSMDIYSFGSQMKAGWNKLWGIPSEFDQKMKKLDFVNSKIKENTQALVDAQIELQKQQTPKVEPSVEDGGGHVRRTSSSRSGGAGSATKRDIEKEVERSASIKVGGLTDIEPTDIYEINQELKDYIKTWEEYKKTTKELTEGEKLFDKILGSKTQEDLRANIKEWDNLISAIKETGDELPDLGKEYDDIVQKIKKAHVIDTERGDSAELIKDLITEYEWLLKYDEADKDSLAIQEEHYLQIVALNKMLYEAKIKAAQAAKDDELAMKLQAEYADYIRQAEYEIYTKYRGWRREFIKSDPVLAGLLPEEKNLEIFDRLIKKIEDSQKAVTELWKQLMNVTTADIFNNPERSLESIKQIEDQFKQLGVTIPKALNNKKHLAGILSTTNAIGNLTDTVANAWKATVQAQLDAGKLTEEEAEAQFERIKKMEIASAIVNTIAGAVGAFMQDKKAYPAPYNYIIASIDAAATLATGWAQIQQIRNQTISGGGSQSGPNVIVGQATPLLNEAQDINQLDMLSAGTEQPDQRVYVVESDITDAQNRQKVRVQDTTF